MACLVCVLCTESPANDPRLLGQTHGPGQVKPRAKRAPSQVYDRGNHAKANDKANAALEKVMGMLGGNPAAIEAAKKAAAAAIQGTLATGEDAEAAQRNAIAAQLGRNADTSPHPNCSPD